MYAHFDRWRSEPTAWDPDLSVIIPAFNEADRIVPTIGAVASQICDMNLTWELILADDGSTDDTIAITEGLGLVNLRVLRAPANGGKGSAVRRGMAAARGRYLLFLDADNSTPIEEVATLLPKLTEEDYDIVVGSRAANGASEASRSALRQLMSDGLRWLVNNVFQLGVQDTQCGFKLYTRDAADRIICAQTIMGFSFDLEHLYLAQKYGFRVAEVPVNWVDAPGSKVSATKEAQRFLRDMLRIRLNDFRGAYEGI